MYNLFQYAGYLYVFGACLWVIYKHGLGLALSHLNINVLIWDAEGKSKVYPMIRDQLFTVQAVACLEIFHALMKWVKSAPSTVLMQVLLYQSYVTT